MDKSLAGLVAVAGVLALPVQSNPVQAAAAQPSNDVMRASSYAELLQPIPNAAAELRRLERSGPASESAGVQDAQYWYYYPRRYWHHHHHHHHSWYRHHHHHHWYRHHHHHHDS